MYRIQLFIILLLSSFSLRAQEAGCINENFSNGFTGWNAGTGTFSSTFSTDCHGIECNSNSYTIHTNTSTFDPNRFNILTTSTQGFDDYGCFPTVRPGSSYSVKLGNSGSGAQSEQLINEFTVDANEPYFIYYSAVVLEDPNHASYQQPFFDVRMYDISDPLNINEIACSKTVFVSGASLQGFTPVTQNCQGNTIGKVYVRDWAATNIDLSPYVNKKVRIVFTTADCSAGAHFGYAYIDASCLKGAIYVEGRDKLCKGEALELRANGLGLYENETYSWNFGDGSPLSTAKEPSHTYATSGIKNVTLTVTLPVASACSLFVLNQELNIEESCEEFDCSECVPSFSPLPGQKYLLSAWVKEEYVDKYPDTYAHGGIKITFNQGAIALPVMRAKGPIIDGWQRIEESFTVPATASNIQIELVNEDAPGNVYFDDIRIHPFRSNMKSFVYNPSTQKLIAELDENNYSTRYEYDDEGILIRVKKETERGVMTIKESRNNQSKINVRQ